MFSYHSSFKKISRAAVLIMALGVSATSVGFLAHGCVSTVNAETSIDTHTAPTPDMVRDDILEKAKQGHKEIAIGALLGCILGWGGLARYRYRSPE